MWIDKAYPYEKLFFPWYIHPEYKIEVPEGCNFELTNEEMLLCQKVRIKYGIEIYQAQIMFRRNKINELKGMFYQEFPEDDISCFLSSGNPFFNLQIVKQRLGDVGKPLFETDIEKIYEAHNGSYHYVCGADTAEGVGGDFSTAAIWCRETMRQVASMRCNLKPSEFAHKLVTFCNRFKEPHGNMPFLGVERNNHGHAVLLELQNKNYNNLFFFEDGRSGWLSNSVSKPIMLNGLRDHLDSNIESFHDKTFLEECLTFINDNGKLNAIDGKHDDTITANAIAIQMLIKSATPMFNQPTNIPRPFAGSLNSNSW
jgi:hypothetical protein